MEESGKHVLSAIEEPKLIPKKSLAMDERVVFESRPSCWSCMKAAALALTLAIAANILWAWGRIPNAPDLPYASTALSGISGGIAQSAFAIVALIALIAAVWFFYLRWMSRRKTVYAATDERIILRKGILAKGYDDIPLTMIEQIRVRQSLWHWFLGYGTLIFSTKGLGVGGGRDMIWEAVPSPMTVRTTLQEVMDIRVKPDRTRKRGHAAD
jgi:membrane protein YdbS with pleckstrin-like domain